MSRWIKTDVAGYYPDEWIITFRCKNPRCGVETQLSHGRIENWHVCDVDCWNCRVTNTYHSEADRLVIGNFKAAAIREAEQQESERLAEEESWSDDDYSAAWTHPLHKA